MREGEVAFKGQAFMASGPLRAAVPKPRRGLEAAAAAAGAGGARALVESRTGKLSPCRHAGAGRGAAVGEATAARGAPGPTRAPPPPVPGGPAHGGPEARRRGRCLPRTVGRAV